MVSLSNGSKHVLIGGRKTFMLKKILGILATFLIFVVGFVVIAGNPITCALGNAVSYTIWRCDHTFLVSIFVILIVLALTILILKKFIAPSKSLLKISTVAIVVITIAVLVGFVVVIGPSNLYNYLAEFVLSSF